MTKTKKLKTTANKTPDDERIIETEDYLPPDDGEPITLGTLEEALKLDPLMIFEPLPECEEEWEPLIEEED